MNNVVAFHVDMGTTWENEEVLELIIASQCVMHTTSCICFSPYLRVFHVYMGTTWSNEVRFKPYDSFLMHHSHGVLYNTFLLIIAF